MKVYIVMCCAKGEIDEQIERIFSSEENAEKWAEHLQETDDSFGQYEYYVKDYYVFETLEGMIE